MKIIDYFFFLIKKMVRLLSRFVLFDHVLVVLSGGGFGFSINGKANYEFAKINFKHYKIVLVVGRKSAEGASLRSFRGMLYLHFSKYILADNGIPFSVCLKNKVVVQTWHGSPIKKIGLDDLALLKKLPNYELKAMMQQWSDTNFVICSSPYVQDLIRSAFGVKSEQALIAFTPYIQKVLAKRKASKVVPATVSKAPRKIFYMPTYRDWVTDRGWDLLENKDFINYLDSAGVICLYKYHPLDSYSESREKRFNTVRVDGDYLDLLSECDFFITDYSSALFEALMLDCRVLIYALDFVKYEEERGIYDLSIYSDLTLLNDVTDFESVFATSPNADEGLAFIKKRYLSEVGVEESKKLIVNCIGR